MARQVDETEAREDGGGADRRMAGEGHLRPWREDAHPPRVARVGGREHEGGLGEIELPRERLHGAVAETARVREDCELVAAERARGEHVGDDEAIRHRYQAERNARFTWAMRFSSLL